MRRRGMTHEISPQQVEIQQIMPKDLGPVAAILDFGVCNG
jgi:hypothetical protein